jgi:hypothetical protein
VAADILDRSFGHYFATEATGAGPQVDDVVGRLDRILVMLHDDDRISQIPQTAKRRQQPLVVALMQPDARLIEYVQDAHEA